MYELLFEFLAGVLGLGVILCFVIMYIMYTRIKQLTTELRALKNRVEITDEELGRLAYDIEEFKKLKF
jgi:ABC-type lipoprotein release transport system permease subunit